MYPEIMVIPMREELTRLGIEELRSAAEVDRFVQNEPGHNHAGGQLHLRMRRRPYASRGAHGFTEYNQAREIRNRIRRPGHGSHGPRPSAFCQASRRRRHRSPFCATAR